jgi:hypothetical protein
LKYLPYSQFFSPEKTNALQRKRAYIEQYGLPEKHSMVHRAAKYLLPKKPPEQPKSIIQRTAESLLLVKPSKKKIIKQITPVARKQIKKTKTRPKKWGERKWREYKKGTEKHRLQKSRNRTEQIKGMAKIKKVKNKRIKAPERPKEIPRGEVNKPPKELKAKIMKYIDSKTNPTKEQKDMWSNLVDWQWDKSNAKIKGRPQYLDKAKAERATTTDFENRFANNLKDDNYLKKWDDRINEKSEGKRRPKGSLEWMEFERRRKHKKHKKKKVRFKWY